MRWLVRLAVVTTLLCVLSLSALGQKTRIELWLIGDAETGSYAQVYKQIEPHLQAAFPHLDIDLHYVVGPHDRFIVAHAADIAPDIVTMSTGQAPQFIEKGMLVPIDYEVFGVQDSSGLKDLFYPGAINSMYMYDDVYFMPTETTTFGMYYNINLMQEAGVDDNQAPRTWEELIQTGKKFMREENDAITRTGLALRRGWMWPSFRTAALLRQAGVDWQQDDVANFATPQAIEALELYSRLFHDDRIATAGADDVWFSQGNAAFYLGPSYQMSTMPELTTFDFGTAPYPQLNLDNTVSTSYSYGMFVSATSKHQREAWEIVKFITDNTWAPTWYRTSALLIPREGDWIMDIVGDEPKFTPFVLELEHARLEIAHPEYTRINGAINLAEQSIVNRIDSVRNIMTNLNAQINVFLAENAAARNN